MKLKKGIAVVMVLLLAMSAFSLSAAGRAEKEVIGVLVADFSDQFQVYMMDGMREAADQYEEDFEFVFMDASYDANTQMDQMETLVARGASVVVIMPVDAEASVPMVQNAVNQGVKIVSVNRTLVNQEIAESYVGSDSVESGEILMQQMANLLDGQGKIGVLQGYMGHEPQILRQRGIENILENYPDIEIVANQPANWYRDNAMDVMESWIQSHPDMDAVVAHNDEMAIGALRAAQGAGVAGNMLIAGIDATPEALEFVKTGDLAFTVFQDAKGQGRGSIEAAVQVARGENVSEQVMIPYELVVPEEAESYVERYQ